MIQKIRLFVNDILISGISNFYFLSDFDIWSIGTADQIKHSAYKTSEKAPYRSECCHIEIFSYNTWKDDQQSKDLHIPQTGDERRKGYDQ